METLKITLKQHTPLIHFQHDQQDATLRASEVKPKLDKYLLTELGGGNYANGCDVAKEKKWIISKNNQHALNYKLRIIPSSPVNIWDTNKPSVKNNIQEKKYSRRLNKEIIKLKPYPAFFANMDADYENPTEYKRFSFTEKLTVEFHFFNQDNSLYTYINDKKIISKFFFIHNFGTRSSKGFGSFYPAEDDPLYIKYSSDYSFYFSLARPNSQQEQKYEELFNYIELFYKTIRGGINEKRQGETVFYFKSLMYKYCKEKLEAEWDKRKIKEHFFGIAPTAGKSYDVKDLLGFSTDEQWKSYNNTTVKKSIAIQDHNGQWRQATVNEAKNLPDRMQSPLLIKPIYDNHKKCYTVFLRFISNRVKLQEFLSYQKMCIMARISPNVLFIDLPSSFKLSNFFEYILSNIDIATHVEEKFHHHPYFEKIQKIYEDLKPKK